MTAARLLSTAACLMGGAGVIAAAAAGHSGGDARWAAAAQMLLVHAIAALELTRWARTVRPALLLGTAAALEIGAILFSADMAVRSMWGQALFPMAAPIGGTLLIAAWLAAAAVFASSLSKS